MNIQFQSYLLFSGLKNIWDCQHYITVLPFKKNILPHTPINSHTKQTTGCYPATRRIFLNSTSSAGDKHKLIRIRDLDGRANCKRPVTVHREWQSGGALFEGTIFDRCLKIVVSDFPRIGNNHGIGFDRNFDLRLVLPPLAPERFNQRQEQLTFHNFLVQAPGSFAFEFDIPTCIGISCTYLEKKERD